MTIKASKITACKECGSTALSWQTSIVNRSDVPQGRLNTRDVECVFFLGCDHCSETLKMVSADKVACLMNSQTEQDQAYYRLNAHNNETERCLDEAVELLGEIVQSGQAYRECTDKGSPTGLRVATVLGNVAKFQPEPHPVPPINVEFQTQDGKRVTVDVSTMERVLELGDCALPAPMAEGSE